LFSRAYQSVQDRSSAFSATSRALHQAIREVLSAAIHRQLASRIRLEHPNGFSYGEAFRKFWQVYEREGEPCFQMRREYDASCTAAGRLTGARVVSEDDYPQITQITRI